MRVAKRVVRGCERTSYGSWENDIWQRPSFLPLFFFFFFLSSWSRQLATTHNIIWYTYWFIFYTATKNCCRHPSLWDNCIVFCCHFWDWGMLALWFVLWESTWLLWLIGDGYRRLQLCSSPSWLQFTHKSNPQFFALERPSYTQTATILLKRSK